MILIAVQIRGISENANKLLTSGNTNANICETNVRGDFFER